MIGILTTAVFVMGALFGAAAITGAAYVALNIATILMLREPAAASGPAPAVSVLVPLRGAERGLRERLAALLEQDYAAPAQIVCAVADADDPAAAIVRALVAEHSAGRVELVIDARSSGPNRKISNLVNAIAAAEHDIVVMLDSDILVDRGYLARVVAPLAQEGVGAVSHLYHGVSAGGVWAELSALSINAQFIPSVILALRFRLAQPCFGATIAMSRAFLDSLGGLAAFADRLQDDYAIGLAVRAAGREVAIVQRTVAHVCTESSVGAFFDAQLRGGRVVRIVNPSGYAGSIVTHPLPFAVAAAILLHNAAGLAALVLILLLRAAQTFAVQRVFALPAQSYLLLPLRDLLGFAAYVGAYVAPDVVWRGQRYGLSADGRMTPRERKA